MKRVNTGGFRCKESEEMNAQISKDLWFFAQIRLKIGVELVIGEIIQKSRIIWRYNGNQES